MHRRDLLRGILGCAAGALLPSCSDGAPRAASAVPALTCEPEKWKSAVDDPAWQVLFEEATERPFSSPLEEEKRAGTFVCAACRLPLFESRAKFDSGTGWPSFFESIPDHVVTKTDFKLLYPRVEYHCARCGGHQGHVFDDGPEPTGKRYCNNGVALAFVPKETPLPPLRDCPA